MELPVLLQYVSQALGLETLELNEHGVLSLRFNGTIDLHVEPDPDGVHCHVYSPLCRVPEQAEPRLALFEAVLSGNCFGRGSGGAAFAYDEHNREILLCRQIVLATTDPQQLQNWMRDMLVVMETWQQRLPEILGQAAGSELESGPSAEIDRMQFIRP